MRLLRSMPILLASVGLVVAAPTGKTWDSLGQIHSGDRIEVITSGGAEKGAFVSSSTESLTIQSPGGERKFLRPDVVRVVLRTQPRRMRNVLIGAGAGAATGLVTDQTLGRYLRNESNPSSARALIWAVPIAAGSALGAAFPSYRVIYRR